MNDVELYHVLNRGVEKRDLFMDDQDRARFVHDLYEFNDEAPARNVPYHYQSNIMGLRNPIIGREKIVDIHGWCLMKNHYHLLVSERMEGGLTKFTRKINVGYANYFNGKYERSGTLFQGRTKKKHIDSDAYFLHILNYIHLNPLDLLKDAKDWRERRITNASDAMTHLQKYRWSSYLDYAGTKNFPSILTKTLFQGVFGDVEKATEKYLKSIELESVRPFLLE